MPRHYFDNGTLPYTASMGRGVCQFWLSGSCPKSEEECAFAHSGTVEKRPEKCRFYAHSTCAKGLACIFMHETHPCAEFVIDQCDKSDCKFSHAPLTDDHSRSLAKEELLTIASDMKDSILEAESDVEKERLLDGLLRLRTTAASKGIDLERGVGEEEENLFTICNSLNGVTDEEVDFTSYNGPKGDLSKHRYAENGTYVNFRYAQNNMAKFEAYEEMEKRIMTLYNEISIDKYESLSKQLRAVD